MSDLSLYKTEIKRVLEGEIVQRYYYQNGRAVQAFQYDLELKKAAELINNKTLTASVLNGEGNYKVIGKPSIISAQVAD